MKEITINCAGLTDPAGFCALLARQLDLPESSDSSPDTLYDRLITISQETHVTIFGFDTLAFAESFRGTLMDAEADNFWLNISIA